MAQYKFKELLEFPCDQHMRIIVVNEETQPIRLLDTLNEMIPDCTTPDSVIDSRNSANGKYVSYTVRVRFESAEQIEKLYDDLPKIDFVKHLL